MTTEGQIQEARTYVDQYSRDGGYLVRLCGDVLLNLAAPPQAQQQGLLEFYRRSLELIGSSIRFVRNGESARWKTAPKDPSALLADWFAKPGRKGSHVLTLESSARADDVSDAAFEFSWVLGSGYVRLVLPAKVLAEDPERFSRTAAELASLVDYQSGTAGFSANIHLDHDSSEEDSAIGRIGQRYPGVDLGKPLYWSDLVVHGLKTVNWLTFLGPAFLEKVQSDADGPRDLAASLGPDIALTRAGRGQMIQAGARPQLGGGPASELAAYRRLALALRRLKIPPQILRGYDGIGGTDNTRRWLDRFDA